MDNSGNELFHVPNLANQKLMISVPEIYGIHHIFFCLEGSWGQPQGPNLGVKPTWLLRETENSDLEADPRIPPNQKYTINKKKSKKKATLFYFYFAKICLYS